MLRNLENDEESVFILSVLTNDTTTSVECQTESGSTEQNDWLRRLQPIVMLSVEMFAFFCKGSDIWVKQYYIAEFYLESSYE